MQYETLYAQCDDDVSIAYQVIGDGPRDLIYMPGVISHVEFWQVVGLLGLEPRTDGL